MERYHRYDTNFAVLPNNQGLRFVVYDDAMLEETGGRLGRIHLRETIISVAQQIGAMTPDALAQFVREVSQERGAFHNGRLELDLAYSTHTPVKLAENMLAHVFAISREVLIRVGEDDIFSVIPPAQAVGLRNRLNDRFISHAVAEDIEPGDTIHLLSDGRLMRVAR